MCKGRLFLDLRRMRGEGRILLDRAPAVKRRGALVR